MTSKKNIVFISAVSLLFSIGVIAASTIKDVQAIDTWSWNVDPSCGNSNDGYNCNIPVDANGNALIPDLVESIPQQIGLQNSHQTTTIRISTSIANIGDGQWQMRSETPATPNLPQLAKQQLLKSNGSLWNEYTTSQFEYHPAHKHFHIAEVTAMELYLADGPDDTEPTTKTNVVGHKVTTCLIDWVKIDDNSPNNQRAYSDCNGQFQGVSPEWMDQYHHALEGQELDVTNVPSGYYFIVITANPEHNFIEKDFANNQSWVLVYYDNDDNGNPKLDILNNSGCPFDSGLCEYSPNR
jgi:hypothetical protein